MKTLQRCGSKAGDDAVGLGLVIARRDPDLAALRHADLRRAQHMAGRVERDLDAVAGQDLAVVRGLDRHVAEAFFQDRRGQRMADVEV